MAQQLLTNYSNALKEILLPYIRDNFPKQTILLDQMKRNAGVNVINDEFIAPIRTSRHGGVANLGNDGNNIVSASGPGLGRGTVPVKIVSGAFNISKLTIDASKSNQLAVQSALEFDTKTLTEDFARQVNRQMYNDGVGVVTKVRTTGGSVGVGTVAVEAITASIDDGRTLDWYGTINGDISPTKYLAVDQVVGVGTAAAALGTISAVTGTSFVSGGPTAVVTAAEDAVYIVDGSGGGAGSAELLGIRAALSSSTGTSTYAGQPRNTVGWTPQFGSASEALTLSAMELTYLKAKEFAGMNDKFIILVNVTLYKKYGDILTAMRRTVNSSDLLGGWTGLEFAAGAGSVGVFLDYDVPDGEVIVLDLDSWTLCQVSDLNWLEDPSGGGLLRLQNTIQYQATMVWFANIFCLAPAANGKQTRKTS